MAEKKNQVARTVRKTATKAPRTVRSTLNHASATDLTRRTTIYLSEGTWKELKIAAIEEKTTLSQLIEQLSRDYLKTTKRI